MLPAPNSPFGIDLRELLPAAQWIGAPRNVTACTATCATVLPGDLFAAIVGPDRDGHDEARAAVRRGAAVVLAERELPLAGAPQCIVPDTREAYGLVCQALAGDPSRRLKVIGVTGTAGKTSTCCLIAGVLEAAQVRVGILGSLGYSDGLTTLPLAETTPDAAILAKRLADAEAAGCTHVVLEATSVALAQRRLAGIELDAACITNVRRNHLEYHGSVANYRRAKARLFEYLAPDGLVILNADDPACAGYLASLQNPVLTVGQKSLGEVTAILIERVRSEQTFLLTAGNQSAVVRTRIIGDGHLQNCLIAAAIGLAYGIELTTVVRGLESVERIPGRMDRIECGQPFGVFVDAASTPEALAETLRSLRQVTEGRLLCVLGADPDGQRLQRPEFGRVAECGADVVVLTSAEPGCQAHEPIIAGVLGGCQRPAGVKIRPSRDEAVAFALAAAKPGDTVLIAGRDPVRPAVKNGKAPTVSDRELSRNWLYRHNASQRPQVSPR
jgi:UDP-N-acetylmuramoyl-L-alanyl-D-glutamate--2,6-diaminopimelate ligase